MKLLARAGKHTRNEDVLGLLFMCVHPSLSTSSAIALTLRAVGGLTTEEIASAFLVPETTMAQRISRAKATIRASGVPFKPVEPSQAPPLDAVLHVLYLMFNEAIRQAPVPICNGPTWRGKRFASRARYTMRCRTFPMSSAYSRSSSSPTLAATRGPARTAS